MASFSLSFFLHPWTPATLVSPLPDPPLLLSLLPMVTIFSEAQYNDGWLPYPGPQVNPLPDAPPNSGKDRLPSTSSHYLMTYNHSALDRCLLTRTIYIFAIFLTFLECLLHTEESQIYPCFRARFLTNRWHVPKLSLSEQCQIFPAANLLRNFAKASAGVRSHQLRLQKHLFGQSTRCHRCIRRFCLCFGEWRQFCCHICTQLYYRAIMNNRISTERSSSVAMENKNWLNSGPSSTSSAV